jgi:hypothetical protein
MYVAAGCFVLIGCQGGGVCLRGTPCGSQAYPYLLLVQVIRVLRLKVEGGDQRCQEPTLQR